MIGSCEQKQYDRKMHQDRVYMFKANYVLCPLSLLPAPFQDLRHVLAVFDNILLVFDQLVAHSLF